MSLDIYLTSKRDEPTDCDVAAKLLRDNGFDEFANVLESQYPHGDTEVFDVNITHNLGRMASECGLYDCMWRPDEHGLTKASQVAPLLRVGIEKLVSDEKRLQQFNPENGWGDYDGLLRVANQYLAACERYPDADVMVSR